MTAFSDDFQCAGCRLVIVPNINPATGDRMPVQIQRNNFTISGNLRSGLRSHAPFNIRQQLDSCAILCRIHRRLKVCAVGRCAVLRHDLYGHLLSASKACAIVIHALMQASVAANSALAILPFLMPVGRAADAIMATARRCPFMRMFLDGNIERTYVSAGIYILFFFAFCKAVCFNTSITLCQQVRHLFVNARILDR